MTQRLMQHHQRTTWLWWTAFFLLVGGGTITYLLSIQKLDPDARAAASVSLAITCIGAGICIICATANWWLKR